jgi:2-iminobutanoate/2-iminopropanoate deaminase
MSKKAILTDQAPAPIGPYSQAILVGDTLYVSGQIAIDPATGELDNPSLKSETERVMSNLQAVLAAAGMDFSHVLKCSIFLVDMEDFHEVNQIYGRFFGEAPPARETVEVSCLPKNVRVEISCIAQSS